MLTHFRISVSHHAKFRLVNLDMWYLNAIHHHDGCQLVHPTKWEHFFNAIHHHNGCRLVHPAKWDIGQFRAAFMTDSVGEFYHVGHSVYRFNSRCQELTNSFIIQSITHMQLIVNHFNCHIFKSICTSVISFQRYTHFIFIWYATKTLGIKIGSVNKPKLLALVSFPLISVLG